MLPYRAALLCGSLVLACTEPATAESAPKPTPVVEAPQVEAPPPPTIEVKAETPAPAPADAVTLDTKVGVEACDDYVVRYRACIEKVLASERQTHTTALLSQLKTWVAAKADPRRASALADECTAAAAAARASTRVVGCVWSEGDSETPEVPKGGKQPPKARGMVDPLDGL